MDANALFREGRLAEAIAALNEALRSDPTDLRSRTFLFELLCFSGDLDRAHKQLDAISAADVERQLAAHAYREALRSEEQRRTMFKKGELPDAGSSPSALSGTINGEHFSDLTDADPRIGARLEAIVGGRYTWMPFEHLVSVTIEPPKNLRDLFWAPAEVKTSSALGNYEGQVMLPALTPSASEHPDDAVRLGRVTEWQELDDGIEAPVGQKLLLADDEVFPFLEIREIVIHPPGS